MLFTEFTVIRSARVIRSTLCAALLAALAGVAGCTDAPKKVVNRYPALPQKKVPPYMRDTIFEFTDLAAIEPFPVSGYGLVANLRGTGGSRAPTPVRTYMIKEMQRHGFGGLVSGLATPEDVLNNKSFAIVRVNGFIPPGARAGSNWSTWFDVHVTALPESDTTSLAHGDLYECALKVDGANPRDPGSGMVTVMGQAKGSIFVNPAYALDDSIDTVEARRARRNGVVLGGARVLNNRPLLLHLRSPERRMARAIQNVINERFQNVIDTDLPNSHVADARDEGTVAVNVPRAYADDWKHFAGVMTHLYMNGAAPDYAAVMATKLVAAAQQPNAPLLDISYALEGLGHPGLHALQPLLKSPKPDVQYAGARAAAFIGDPAGASTLVDIAAAKNNPFRVNAVDALGELPQSPLVDEMLRTLLGSDQAMVRIQAYKVLAKHHDRAVFTQIVKHGATQKFVLDIIPSAGPPLIYASRQDLPRLAIFGTNEAIDTPISFTTMQDRLSIASVPNSPMLTLFYRPPGDQKPINIPCTTDLAQVAARLGGEAVPGNPALNFSYADVVAIVQALVGAGDVSGSQNNQTVASAFVLQDMPKYEEAIDTAPLLRNTGRPQTPSTAPATTMPTADAAIRR